MDIALIQKLHSEGFSLAEIARKVGCSRGAVHYHCGDHVKEPNTNCAICNKAIYRRPSRKSSVDRNFCSKGCRNKFYSKENSFTWKGGVRNKTKDRLNEKLRGKQNKEKAVALLGGKCSKCGYDRCLAALDFHHSDPSTKDSEIKNLIRGSWRRLAVEIGKCVLLCANCHREEHWTENNGSNLTDKVA